MSIQAIFVAPGLAFARLGGSSTPQSAFDWIDTAAPRVDGETSIKPAWSLAVEPDGSVQPFLPDKVTFRDGDLVRPVAPFYEIWARVGDAGSAPETWQDVPLTPALLAEEGASVADLSLRVTARNLKAARRAGNPDLAFGTFPALELAGDDNARVTLAGVSPPGVARPMVPPGRAIPLGSVQILRSVPHQPGQPWSDAVNTETLRFRYTPAAGIFYGPPAAAQAAPQNGRVAPAVRPENAFLDPAAGWFGASTNGLVSPGDTYDVVNQGDPTGASLGVVDDTCEVHFEVTLAHGADPLAAKSVAFVGPPDFAPDRRPFLSAADELNDREADADARSAALTDAELDRWVEDLFERVYETVSLFNVDSYRVDRAAPLPADKRRADDLDHGARNAATSAMGGRDALRNALYALAGATPDNPLPLSTHARMRHRALSDLQNLIELVSLTPDRMQSLVRPPFEIEGFETANQSSMRMPPFMRQSNALPLTLSHWQYALLLRWVERTSERLSGGVFLATPVQAPRMSPEAAARRAEILAGIDAAAQVP